MRVDALHCIVRSDVQPNTTSNKTAHTPVYLRSFKTPAPKASIAPKIAQLMTELQVAHTRLVMPTRENCTHLENLLDAAAALVETKKLVDKVESDVKVAQARLRGGPEHGVGEGSVSGGGAGGGGGKGTPAPMDVDEDAEGEVDSNGRGQSVVSTRSARVRRPVSLSLS